jgi:hypothetical protein
MPSSIFDRLSQQGTVASRQRDAEEKQSRCLKNEQRRQMEVALTPSKNDKKLKALQRSPITAPQDQTNQKKQSIVASPKQKDALYDRLAKQDTISSAAHHGKSFQDNNNGAVLRTQCRKSPKRTDSERAATFDRLYKQDTASSKAHRHKQLPEETSFFSPKKTIAHTPPPSLLTRRLEVDSADTGPPIPLKINIYIRTNEEKKDGKPYNDHFDLTQKEVRKQINLYAASKISAKALAYEIINALFHRDFTPGRHWEVSSAQLEELDTVLDEALVSEEKNRGAQDNSIIDVFDATKTAVYDHKDIYIVAKASAKIKISSEAVYVDEYSYTSG